MTAFELLAYFVIAIFSLIFSICVGLIVYMIIERIKFVKEFKKIRGKV